MIIKHSKNTYGCVWMFCYFIDERVNRTAAEQWRAPFVPGRRWASSALDGLFCPSCTLAPKPRAKSGAEIPQRSAGRRPAANSLTNPKLLQATTCTDTTNITTTVPTLLYSIQNSKPMYWLSSFPTKKPAGEVRQLTALFKTRTAWLKATSYWRADYLKAWRLVVATLTASTMANRERQQTRVGCLLLHPTYLPRADVE